MKICFTIAAPVIVALSGAVLLASSAQAAAPDFQKVLEGAKREGKLVVWVSTPAREKTHRLLLEAFNKRFGLKTQWEWVAMHPTQSATRVVAEASAGKVTPDVVGAGNCKQIMALVQAKLLKPYSWVEVFESGLPGMKGPVEAVMKDLRGVALSWFDNAYGIAWNTKLIEDSKIPDRFEQLTNPQWEGKLIVSITSGGHFDTMSLEFGRGKAIAFAKKIKALKPILKRGTPAVTAALTVGEAPVALSSFFNAERAALNGEPVKFKFFVDYIPLGPLHIYVPEGSPNPNTARLFAAWAVTEGSPIFEQEEVGGRVNDPRSKVAKLVKERAGKAKVIFAETMKDADQEESVAREVETILTSGR